MFSLPGPDAPLTMQSERTGIENKWYALKGRVVELKVEEGKRVHLHGPTTLAVSKGERWDCYACKTIYTAKLGENLLPRPVKTGGW
jgi:hypothetical protein